MNPLAGDNSRCPRCDGGFHCGVNDTTPCACTTLHLTDVLRARLREDYRGCLCVRCLAELSVPGDSPRGIPLQE